MTNSPSATLDPSGTRDRFLRLSTSLVCDAFDDLGEQVLAFHESVRPVNEGQPTLAGWAYPIAGRSDDRKGPDRLKLEVVDQVPTDSVTVWAANDAQGICLFGDLIASTLAARGSRGAVVSGGVRDIDAIRDLSFPVFARYVSPVQSIGRWIVTSHNEPVYLPGALGTKVRVAPGDFVFGDRDGCVVIPRSIVASVLEIAERTLATEARAREDGADGLSAIEMLERYGHV